MYKSVNIYLKLKTMWAYTTIILSNKQRDNYENQWNIGKHPKLYLKNDRIWKIKSALMLTWLRSWSLEIINKNNQAKSQSI